MRSTVRAVVDVIDKARQIGDDILKGLVRHRINRLDLERFHEALGLGIVVGIAASAHGADQAVVLDNLVVRGRCVLRAAIGMVNASGKRPAGVDRRLQRGDRPEGR